MQDGYNGDGPQRKLKSENDGVSDEGVSTTDVKSELIYGITESRKSFADFLLSMNCRGILQSPFLLFSADSKDCADSTQQDKQARKVDPDIPPGSFCQRFPQAGQPYIGKYKQLGWDICNDISENQRLYGQAGAQLKCHHTNQKNYSPVQFMPVAAGVFIDPAAKI